LEIYLEYHDEKSAKFWKIQVNGASHTVTYGKIGKEGQSKTKDFDSEKVALKDAEKLTASKKKKGYQESGKAENSKSKEPSSGFDHLINAKNQTEALCKHFSYLADSPGFTSVLKAIMKKVEKVEVVEDNLVLRFPENEKLTANPPGKASDYTNWPKSFKACMSKHEFLSFPEEDYGIILGNHLNYDISNLTEDFLGESEVKDVLSPLFDYVDPWLFHPQEKNAYGDPMLYLYDHEYGDVLDPSEYNIGSQFLLLLAKALRLDLEPEEQQSELKLLKAMDQTFDLLTLDEEKNYISYAKRYQDYLFTIEEKKPNHLIIWDISNLNAIKKVSETDIGTSISLDLDQTKFHFYNHYLILMLHQKYLLFDFSDVSRPKCSLVEEKIFRAQYIMALYLSSQEKLYSYDYWKKGIISISDLPTTSKPDPEKMEVNLSSEEVTKINSWQKAVAALQKDNRLYWITQRKIVTFDISEPEQPRLLDHKSVKFNKANATFVGENKLAALEADDEDYVGCRIFEITKRGLKKSGDLLSKNIVRGHYVQDNLLYLCHRDDKYIKGKAEDEETYRTYVSIVDVSEDKPVVKQTFELPNQEKVMRSIRINDSHLLKICWMGVQNNQISILLGNGKMLYFDLA